MKVDNIWTVIQNERRRQDEKWGGYEHDDQHTAEEWLAILSREADKVSAAVLLDDGYLVALVNMAAVNVAWIEAIYRKLLREAK